MRYTSITFGIATISLLILVLFFVLACGRFPARTSLPTVPISASTNTPVDTVPATTSDSTRQTVATVAQVAASTITSTANTTTSNSVPETWQRFSSKAAGYSLFHPPASVNQSRNLPSISEYVQITFFTPWVSQPPSPPYDLMFLEIRVYDNSEENALVTFLSAQYKAAFGKSTTSESLNALVRHPVKVNHTITGYLMDWRIAATRMLFVVPHNGKFYTFALVHQFSPVELSAEETALFSHIINTIRFE